MAKFSLSGPSICKTDFMFTFFNTMYTSYQYILALLDTCRVPHLLLQAIGDCAQGFCNFLLFCVFQRKVRHYIIHLICRCVGHVNQSDNMKEEDDDDDDDHLLNSIPNNY